MDPVSRQKDDSGGACGPERPMQILHIGNIANNAFVNARLLNESGYDCDVICYDYYHIQGCPEWDEAEFTGGLANQDYPEWWRKRLHGYRRPEWFAQGTLAHCVNYLAARRQGLRLRARLLRLQLWFDRFSISVRQSQWYAASPLSPVFNRLGRITRTNLLTPIINGTGKALVGIFSLAPRVSRLLLDLASYEPKQLLLSPQSCGPHAQPPRPFLQRHRVDWRPAGIPLGMAAYCAFILSVVLPLSAIRAACKAKDAKGAKERPNRAQQIREATLALAARMNSPLGPEDLESFLPYAMAMDGLLQHYDLIIAYATCPFIPMVCGKRPYVAYEHGTIRDIPFEDTPLGRMTALAYSQADCIYMTNADSQPQAHALLPDPSRIVMGLHGFDQRNIKKRLDKISANGAPPDGRFGKGREVTVFFAPARQHWKHGFTSWLKGNDQIIRAARILMDKHPKSFHLVLAHWGKEIELSKELILDLGLGEHCSWTPPLQKTELWHAFNSVDCVLDQFVAPCIGGVTAEALAVGHCPVITHLDDEAMASFYGRTIPLFNCSGPEEIAQAMEWVITDKERCARTVRECTEWMRECHSSQRLLHTLEHAFTTARQHAGAE